MQGTSKEEALQRPDTRMKVINAFKGVKHTEHVGSAGESFDLKKRKVFLERMTLR